MIFSLVATRTFILLAANRSSMIISLPRYAPSYLGPLLAVQIPSSQAADRR
jgi:hypothetical protein